MDDVNRRIPRIPMAAAEHSEVACPFHIDATMQYWMYPMVSQQTLSVSILGRHESDCVEFEQKAMVKNHKKTKGVWKRFKKETF
jgi:hypothetical protein